MRTYLRYPLVAFLGVALHANVTVHGQGLFTPEDLGQTVNGFQDNFTGPTRDPNWTPVPPELDMYEQTGGVLKVTVVGETLDTHLIYTAPGYSDTVQEVLARIRVTAFGTGDAPRCGVAVAVNPDTSQGINLHFRDHTQDGVMGRQFKLLDDRRAWGPRGLDIDWVDNTWYWLRLRQIGPGTGATNNIQAKVWLADGSVPEPGDWQINWRRSGRTGFAGLVGSSIGGLSEYEVDYILIKAEGLPSTKVAVEAFPTPFFLSIKQHPTNTTADLGQTATFQVDVSSPSAPGIQWQRATAGSANFVDILGATARTYTTPPLTAGDNGTSFRAVASLSGANVVSRSATLTIEGPPKLVSASAALDRSLDKVVVVFSEPVTAASATNAANYVIGSIPVQSATLSANGTNLVLALGTPLATTGSYTLSVSGVQDLAGNTITPNSQMSVRVALYAPSDFGQTAAAFQDDFTAAARDPNWLPVPPEKDMYEQVNGLLKVTVQGDSPGLDTHLLYQGATYNDTVQEVLARIRVTAFGTGDAPRCGISVAVDPETSQGINLHFRDNDQDAILGRQFKLLDDRRAWGPPGLDIDWENNTWYWLRLRQTDSSGTEGPNIFAKAWPGDGTAPEPNDWQTSWARSGRIGLAGIVGSSIGGLSEFEVDYILIKSDGLPNVKIGASAFPDPSTAPPPRPSLGVTRSGSTITLTWSGGALESATQITGPWTIVPGATSPRAESISASARFYRVRR